MSDDPAAGTDPRVLRIGPVRIPLDGASDALARVGLPAVLLLLLCGALVWCMVRLAPLGAQGIVLLTSQQVQIAEIRVAVDELRRRMDGADVERVVLVRDVSTVRSDVAAIRAAVDPTWRRTPSP